MFALYNLITSQHQGRLETKLLDDLCCTVFNRCYAYDKVGNLIQSADQRGGVINLIMYGNYD